ncbi:MAG TPA: hypothetical protein PLN21_12425 [Gemmatales bacterium]|nr:hypothetical protein [Gemmatales bacterium]
MIEQAIPRGTTSRKYAQIALILLCFTLLAGCRKVEATNPVLTPEGTRAGGNQQGAGPGEGAGGRSAILQLPFDQIAKAKLLSIGYVYRMALASGKPPKDAEELGAGSLKTKRDMQEHEVEVVYGVNPARLDNPADYMIAWEKEPTNDGYRMVMMADFTTVKYVSKAEFEKMKRAK